MLFRSDFSSWDMRPDLIYQKWYVSLMDVACHSPHVGMFLLGLLVHLCVHKKYLGSVYEYLCHVILLPLDMEDLVGQEVR